jgi:type VII secretion protein EccB
MLWSRREQLSAYQFLRRRLVSALLTGDANHPESPSKRLVIAMIAGLVVSILTFTGFTIYGLFKPGGATSWKTGGQIIVERETGARYVLAKDGVLHPVLNYASALLLLGSNNPSVVSVSQRSLRTASRGPLIGIFGAPDSLASEKSLLSGPWSTCSQTDQQNQAQKPSVTAVLGGGIGGQPIADGLGVLVTNQPDGARYLTLVSGGRRYRVSTQVAAALGYADQRAIRVGTAWLNTIPAGKDLAFLAISGRGKAGQPVQGKATRIGEVFVIRDGNRSQYFVMLRQLTAISLTQAKLILNDPSPAAKKANRFSTPTTIDPADVVNAGNNIDDALPPEPPQVVNRDLAQADQLTLCAVLSGYRGGLPLMRITVAGKLTLPDGRSSLPVVNPRTGPDAQRAPLADYVFIPPGRGAVVQASSAPGDTGGVIYVITEDGRRYPVDGAETLVTLGYPSTQPQQVPVSIVDLLPTGPQLGKNLAAGPPLSGGVSRPAGS